jgi:hypothetical protein
LEGFRQRGVPLVIHSSREIWSVEDWRRYAPPKRGDDHWAIGRSALESARAWLRGGRPELPEELRALLERRAATSDLRPLFAMPELVTRLDEFNGEHRNRDVIVLAESRGGRTLIGIEAKADESFGSAAVGPYLAAREANKGSNVPERIRRPVRALFGEEALEDGRVKEPYASLRYQVLTALAGTLIEAKRRWAEQAVLVVHEFVSNSGRDYKGTDSARIDRNARALREFVSALPGAPPDVKIDELTGPLQAPGGESVSSELPFFVGKVTVDVGDGPALRQSRELKAL